MKENGFKRVLHVLVVLITASLLVSACQSLPVLTPEQALEKRVTGRMTAMVAQNWAAVYDYSDLDYKKQVPKENFVGMNRDILFSDFSVVSIKIGPSGEDAVVVVKYNMTVMSFDVKDRKETQNWLKTDGQWYYQMKMKSLMD